MKAMIVQRRAPMEEKPLKLVDLPAPEPHRGEVLIRVEVCAICRTDLHVIEEELPIHRNPLIPGHQVVGEIARLGPGAARFRIRERVGVAWLHASCGVCPYCVRGDENLCNAPRFTGYDVNGGYAEYMVALEAFIYPIPKNIPSRKRPRSSVPASSAIGRSAGAESGKERGSACTVLGRRPMW